jgi:hypothetical protein
MPWQAREQHDEFVAAEARDHVFLAQAAPVRRAACSSTVSPATPPPVVHLLKWSMSASCRTRCARHLLREALRRKRWFGSAVTASKFASRQVALAVAA